MGKKLVAFLRLILLFAVMSTVSFSATKVSTGTGNWNTAGTWSPSGVPGTGDTVAILAGHDVTLNADGTCGVLNVIGTLTFSNTSNRTLTITTSGGHTGNIRISGTFTSGGNTGQVVNVAGSMVSTGTINNSAPGVNALKWKFNGTGSKTISNTDDLGILEVNGSGLTLTLQSNLVISEGLTITTGTLDLSTFTADRGVAGGTLTVSNGASLKIGGTNTFPSNYSTHSIGSTSTIEYSGASQTVAALNSSQSYGNLTLSGSGTKSASVNFNVAGTMSVGTSVTFSPTSSVVINNASAAGTLTGSGTVNVSRADGTSTPDFSAQYKFSTYTLTNLTVNYVASSSYQNLDAFTYGNLSLNTSGAAITVDGYSNFNVTGTLTVNSTLWISPGVVVNSAAAQGTLTGSGEMHVTRVIATANLANQYKFTTYSLGSMVLGYWGSGNQTIDMSPCFGLTIGGSGTKTVAANITIGDYVYVANVTLDLGPYTINRASAGGNFSMDGTATLKIGGTNTFPANYGWIDLETGTTVEYNGSGAQSIGAQTYGNLTINNASGGTLAGNATVNGTLTFTSGNITTNSYSVIIPSTGTVSRTSGHVAGNLQKYIATGATSKTFEIGTGSNYTPVAVTFGNVSVAGNLTASTASGDHANIGSSTINSTKSVNRTWTLTNSGITFTNYSATFTFVAGDIDGGASTSNFVVGKYSPSTWTYPTVGTKTATTTQITGVTSFSDFQIGEPPTYSISGNVFEDLNYGGGAGRSKASSSGVGRQYADVELYNSSGVYVSGTNTDANGDYSFTGLSAGTYYVRVVNDSVRSSRTGWSTSCKPVMTYRTNAASGTAVAVTDYVGGTNPSTSDPGIGSSGATFNTTTFVYSAVLTGTAQAVTQCVISSANITGVDFGFNYNTIANTNNSGQGSLRQAITNMNTLTGDASLAQLGLVAGKDNAVFMISNGTSAVGLRSANNYFSGGIATISPTSALTTVSTAMVLDAQKQPGWTSTPVIRVTGGSAGAGIDGFLFNSTSDGSSLRGFMITNFTDDGIDIQSNADNITIAGNWIGTTGTGSTGTGNTDMGIQLSGQTATIGGTNASDRNVITNNGNDGMSINGSGTTSHVIQGNYIGLDPDGNSGVGNTDVGIGIITGAGNTIGGTSAGAGNVISKNIEGIEVNTANNTFQGNKIGTDAGGTLNKGNGTDGMQIQGSITGTTVGGTANGAGNIIAFNALDGVNIVNGTAHRVLGNSIFSNSGLGIDIGSSGVLANNGTKNAGLPNYDMDHPVFTSATYDGTTLTFAGYVGSAPSQPAFANAIVEIFKSSDDASGNGEGQIYLGRDTCDANGNFSGSITTASIAAGNKVTGTATDAGNNTSEFGANYTVTAAYNISGNVFEDVNYGGGVGRSKASSSGVGRQYADVELYNSSGVYVSGTNTDANGDYTITGLAAGTYYVRVVNDSVRSSRTGWSTSCKPVMTYRTNAASGTAVAVTDYVGGTNPSASDPGIGSAGATFNTSTFVYTAVLSGTAQAVTQCVISSANITGVDFGFNFNIIANTNDGGQGTLRQAITNMNTLTGDASLAQSGLVAGKDNAVFMISNGTAAAGLRSANNYFTSGVATITVSSALTTVSTSMVLDAQKQPGWSSAPIIELNGNNGGTGRDGLTITGGSTTVKGLVINRFTGEGIELRTNGSNTIAGCYIGTNSAGSAASANSSYGIYINNVASNTIGGTTSTDRNVIAGNSAAGMQIVGVNADNNIVIGNYFGINAAGTSGISNGNENIVISAGNDNRIGGTNSNERNVSGTAVWEFVWIINGATRNVVQGNYAGLNALGTAPIGHPCSTIKIESDSNTVGGSVPGAGNVISGSAWYGVELVGAVANTVQGNYIGTNAAGTAAIPNGYSGVGILTGGSYHLIGGTTSDARNVISGNTQGGVYVEGSSNNTIKGNYIGLNAAGTAALPNGTDGIILQSSSNNNTIGGTSSNDRNVISGNTGDGIRIPSGTGNIIRGNYIGLNAAGSTAIANGDQGIDVYASNNTIGGTANGAGNVISGNTADGVAIMNTATGNSILGNSFYSNGGLGIDIANDAVTTNNGTKNAGLPNYDMDHPVFTSAVLVGSTLTFSGYVGTAPSDADFANAIIEIFKSDNDASGYGEGQTYLGRDTCDASGNFSGSITVAGVSAGDKITGTATDGSNNTSEFGANYTVTAIYYSKGSLDVHTPSNWNTARDGSGTDASSFGTGNTFVIQNAHAMTLTGSNTWNVSASGTVQIESGGSWTNSSTGAVTANLLQVDNGGTYTHGANAVIPGTTKSFGATSTVVYSGGTQTVEGLTYGNLTFSGFGTRTLGANASVAGNLNISGGVFDLGTYTANRSSAGGTLTVADAATLKIGGTNSFPTNYSTVSLGTISMVEYNGSNQSVAAHTYGNLTLSNGGTKTAAGGLTTAGSLIIGASTTFAGGSYTHSIQLNWANSGTFTAGTSTVQFTGSSDALISGATTFNLLEVNKNASATTVTLNNNVTTPTLTMTQGRISTGANSILVTSSRTGNGLIIGTITRTHTFNAGTTYAFEGPNQALTFNSGGTLPSSVTVTTTLSSPGANDYMDPITRYYDISQTGGTGFSYTLRLHYEDSEVSAPNSETSPPLKIWRRTSTGPDVWTRLGATSNNTTNNWVEQTGLTNIGTFSLSSRTVADVTLSLAQNATNPSPGDQVTYTLNYSNDGDGTSTNTVVTASAPTNTSYVAGQTRLNGVLKTDAADADEVTVSGATITINLGTVGVGGSGTITYKVVVN